ncbi:hypothetical protein [Teredinibacter sp. KSP-S5-2]|uniref:hypothetical protein n=1 Tax=Teredinibacter sp. KSP-S5-2 TaxID=3034506 RepID=UPI00293503E5|nr:hypothetical protein [Teredinibacter sp. KSP-S5-2]WNO10513.1 hypothetical protein P5V12_04940 [Teredinibacter sp. KSP-S5-2]
MNTREIHPLKRQEYLNRYVATVSFNGDSMVVEGGNREKRQLEKAKQECDFCFVKELGTSQSVKLILSNGTWVPEHQTRPQ